MNRSIVWRLIAKDLYLYRWLIAGSLLAGFASLPISGAGSATRIIGLILFMTSIIALGIFIAMYGVLTERQNKSLLFVLSLPLSPMQYTVAKVAASLIAFLVPWVVLGATAVGVAVAFDPPPDGSIPLTVAMMFFFLANFCVLLALLLITRSEYWAIAGILLTNFGIAAYMNIVSQLPSIAEHNDGPVAVWSTTVLTIIAIEAAVAALSLGLTFYVQARRKDFV
jgi:ABC-type transport system involved in multi-copper enzyme maturation permease subunit